MTLALYFGFGSGGHFLRDHNGTCERRLPPGFPWVPNFLDTGLLDNRKVPDSPDGRVHWVCAGRPDVWFGFFWWDRSGDKRGSSNSGFYVRWPVEEVTREAVRAEAPKAFAFACEAWPDVVSRQLFPLRLVEPPWPVRALPPAPEKPTPQRSPE